MSELFGKSVHPKKYQAFNDLPPWWGSRTPELLERARALAADGISEADAVRIVDIAEFGD